jgi:hypothetical protein
MLPIDTVRGYYMVICCVLRDKLAPVEAMTPTLEAWLVAMLNTLDLLTDRNRPSDRWSSSGGIVIRPRIICHKTYRAGGRAHSAHAALHAVRHWRQPWTNRMCIYGGYAWNEGSE